VEAYFPTVGWVAFDPTPGRSIPYPGASSTSPGFKDPFTSGSTGGSTVTTEASPSKLPSRPAGQTGNTPKAAGSGWTARVLWLPWVLGIVALLGAWPLGRKLWRERGLRRGSLTQRFAASLTLTRGSVADFGLAATPSSTFDEVLDLVSERLGLPRDPMLEARAGAVLFGGRHARPEDIQRAEALRREVRKELRLRRGWVRTALSWYGVPQRRSRRDKPALPLPVR